ncbi:MAG: membrane protein insertase YidC [Alphaproteobacteria bacterium CG_4_9_14_3_um_filter_47_13]|nr:MAG: membrane protein insertase YidC [Alphaproteobacteria bacterium CG_4_9_14_3_um_filter_47_13]
MMNNDKDPMHPDDLRNLLTFAVLAIAVWVLYDHFLLKPKMEQFTQAQEAQRLMQQEFPEVNGAAVKIPQTRDEIITHSARLKIESKHLFGSISLVGGRIDDVSLHDYYKSLKKRENVNLFSPMDSLHPRYTNFGWVSAAKEQAVPDKNTKWMIKDDHGQNILTPQTPITLYWENGTGLRFEQNITIDDGYLFKVTQRVLNQTDHNITIYPFSVMTQQGRPEDLYGSWIIHEGPIGYVDNKLIELSYKKIVDKKPLEILADKGWIALTERYWFTGLFPENQDGGKFRFLYARPDESTGQTQPRYQVDIMGQGQAIAPGNILENTTNIYVGPKKLSALESYGKKMGWEHIDLALDFGMYYFLTKPLFYLLHWLGDFAGNFGLGIIMLTFVVRIFVFPLANTSYRSFAALRKVAPQMKELREKYPDNKEKLQAGLVKLYEKEKVNPMAGCLPIIIQIPIFFALFKVLQISVEMRHAPFYGWINDLSAPDPTTIFNLFGLIPWSPPSMLMIGAWPCFMFVFMVLQKMMNPPPQDKMQKAMMNFMPFFITYILSQYAVGLVIYWTFSNGLSVLQQYIIMKSMGVEPHLFKSKEQKEMEKKITEGPAVHPELEMIEHDIEEALFGEDKDKKTEEEEKPVSRPKPKKSKKKKS